MGLARIKIGAIGIGTQRGTVATYVEGSFYINRFFRFTSYKNRNFLCIGTETIKCLSRFLTSERVATQIQDILRIIIKVTPSAAILQLRIIGIGIRAVATTIDIAMNIGENTHRVTTIDIS